MSPPHGDTDALDRIARALEQERTWADPAEGVRGIARLVEGAGYGPMRPGPGLEAGDLPLGARTWLRLPSFVQRRWTLRLDAAPAEPPRSDGEALERIADLLRHSDDWEEIDLLTITLVVLASGREVDRPAGGGDEDTPDGGIG